MYYSQNTHSINTVILSFDSVVTGLAKLRYNYYRRFCKLYDYPLDLNQYYQDCYSYKTMYEHCTIPNQLISKDQLGKKVEEDLYAYSLNHGIKINEGFDELYELIRSKKMEIIYTSTHPKKYTEALFVLTGSLYRPSQFYYDDDSVYVAHAHRPSEVLVITSDTHTLKLANKYHYNVIYYPMVEEENDEITIRSFAVIHHLIEAINLILDKWREPRHQYLLLKDNVSLDDAYQHLIKTSSSTLHDAITKIYNAEKEAALAQELIEEKFEDLEEDLNINEELSEEENFTLPVLEEEIETITNEEHSLPIIEDSEELFEKTMIFNFEKDQIEEENFTLEPFEDENTETHTDIASILNELNQRDQNINHTKVFTKEELKEFGMSENDLYNEDEKESEEKEPIYLTLFNSLVYAIIDSIIVLLAYLAFSIGLYDWIFTKNAPLSFINTIVASIIRISTQLFGNISSTLGQLFNASASLEEGISVFILLTLILWVSIFIKNKIFVSKNMD